MVFKRDDLESALANAVNNALFRQQLIRVGDDGEACDPQRRQKIRANVSWMPLSSGPAFARMP